MQKDKTHRVVTKTRQVTATETFVNDLWVEQTYGAWRLACRVALQRGRPVLVEMRVFPAEEARPYGVGAWSGEGLGIMAPAPTGGLTARLVRSLPLGPALAVLRTIGARDLASVPERGWLLPRSTDKPAAKSTRGRRPRPDAEYERLRDRYHELVRQGRGYCKVLARELGWKEARVRSAIFRARERGLLD